MTDIVPPKPIGGGDKANDVHSSSMSVRGANLPPTVDARLKAVESYWLAIRPVPEQLPGYQHFQPLELSPYWPWMWIFNVHHLPLRFSYRFIGSEHMRAMEQEATGRWVDEIRPRFSSEPGYQQFVDAAEFGRPGYYSGPPTYHVEKSYIGMERLILPMASDGRNVDMILGITIYAYREN